jgi:hypothetical protein
LSGVTPGQEVEVRTGSGGGDCGFRFETGKAYFIYAYRAPDAKLATSICSRTAAIEKAAEDLEYLRSKAGTPETGRLVVKTSYPGFPVKLGTQIAVEGPDGRHLAVVDAAGDAVFEDLPPGTYRAHSVADGDLEDDPKFQLGARGSLDVTLFRMLKIRGRVSGPIPVDTDIELRSVTGEWNAEAGISRDGRYEIRLSRQGRYYLGVKVKGKATWFQRGTVIEFSGTPGVVSYDLTLPDR